MPAMMVYEFASCSKELRYRLDLGWRQIQIDIAVNGFFGIVVCVATLKLQLHDGDASAQQLLLLWIIQVSLLFHAQP